MKLLNRLSAAAAITCLSPVAVAHPGHEVGNSLFHGLLHTEHLAVLFAIAAAAVIAYVFRN